MATTVDITEHFLVPPRIIYECLNDPERLTALMQSPVQYKAVVGEEFVLFGGAVSGKVKELDKNKKIEYLWRFNTWPKEKYSTVIITLEEGDESEEETELHLIQTGVEHHDLERTEGGWRIMYFERMKKMFGY
ncbi:hypothetical protein EIN_056860 [Entamoeba invadens IP1]|uniref:hypothetical protein n=1 Tax=Entamoeba invadens IP1 TaxID=370355 RepID=UPI0002C3F02B|nr:hypothetical protein EIN_056860 [Entamoeba invadens IP1]ELP93301.1 hypothetical protein EIN_056860 [Entamoeba invadens IP1]|eukprot:XP_004260072.1 hypothetical protein EIN_056860 [Entamoeba invadens IP1]